MKQPTADLRLAAVVHHRHRLDLARFGMFFIGSRWDSEPCNAEPHKCGRRLWCNPSLLPTNTVDYPATGTSAFLTGITFTAHNWWAHRPLSGRRAGGPAR
jgi:8-oxo-dGTP diphosphatase